MIVGSPTWPVAVVGFTVLGAAVAVIAPLSFSAAARIAGAGLDDGNRQARVDAVIARFNQFNYAGALLGAVMTGLVGAGSLRFGFAVPDGADPGDPAAGAGVRASSGRGRPGSEPVGLRDVTAGLFTVRDSGPPLGARRRGYDMEPAQVLAGSLSLGLSAIARSTASSPTLLPWSRSSSPRFSHAAASFLSATTAACTARWPPRVALPVTQDGQVEQRRLVRGIGLQRGAVVLLGEPVVAVRPRR